MVNFAQLIAPIPYEIVNLFAPNPSLGVPDVPTPDFLGFSGVGDVLIGKETNKSIQSIGTAAMVVGAVWLLSKGAK